MPNRIIKESIRTSKKINALSDFEFRFWAYLITYVDDYGRGSADPELINNMVFPRMGSLTEDTVAETLHSLQRKECICLYEVDDEPYLFFPNWGKHQSIRNKKSKFPDPSVADATNDELCNQLKSDDSKCPRNPIQSNPIHSRNRNPSARAREDGNDKNDGPSRAVNDYMNRINPEASSNSMLALLDYERDLGSDVCIRAFDIALDEKKTTWSYIRAILNDWKSRGIRCIADLNEMQDKREAKTASPHSNRMGKKYKTVLDEEGNFVDVEVTDEDG